MKMIFRHILFAFSSILLLAACGKNNEEGNGFFENEDWELTCENLAKLKPLHISRDEIVKRTGDNYFVGPSLYQCSDSLGKVCFWNCLNESSFSFSEGEWYFPLAGHEQTEMYRLEEECGYLYKMKSLLSGTKNDPEKSQPRKIRWRYEENSGEFAFAYMNAKTEMGTLMQINKDYIVLKQDQPIFPFSHPTPPEAERVPTNATYTILIYHAMEKSQADKYWYTEANYSQE